MKKKITWNQQFDEYEIEAYLIFQIHKQGISFLSVAIKSI